MHRIPQQSSGRIQQPEVNTPGIDTDSSEFAAVGCSGFRESVLNVVPQAKNIPVQSTPGTNWYVGKAMGFFQLQSLTVE